MISATGPSHHPERSDFLQRLINNSPFQETLGLTGAPIPPLLESEGGIERGIRLTVLPLFVLIIPASPLSVIAFVYRPGTLYLSISLFVLIVVYAMLMLSWQIVSDDKAWSAVMRPLTEGDYRALSRQIREVNDEALAIGIKPSSLNLTQAFAGINSLDTLSRTHALKILIANSRHAGSVAWSARQLLQQHPR